ncbi:hypothetical protein NLY43_05120 [Mesorhizobium sp. C416B]|uniref:hypothetical protein n=1 Tax=unclassified Mesorhizobium TaxID=325217 RepID=UPI0003CE7CE4|nr:MULTISPECIES: hypothetical protein [unclassified Mesorhizobium]ESX42924.1 hypothetical protein X762_29015 [Mesorhizobium sp. LSHC426A00]ESX46719.1 hypothetical protein X761_31155 [Mesorhizobium sp. LSHC424B00]ESX64706.1 hypothetical protein X758_31310 [Mesorhizobium sp. LSHC416B00]WJI64149.1 hypothetical protein NLY43_05120 [Mesorhizobium sp. C416B]
MAIKFSTKDQPAASAAATAKQAKPAAAPKAAEPSATDLFEAPAATPKGKAGKKK